MSITTIKAEFNEQHCNVLCTIKSLEANNYTKLRKPRTTWPSGHVSFLCTSDNIDLLKEVNKIYNLSFYYIILIVFSLVL